MHFKKYCAYDLERPELFNVPNRTICTHDFHSDPTENAQIYKIYSVRLPVSRVALAAKETFKDCNMILDDILNAIPNSFQLYE